MCAAWFHAGEDKNISRRHATITYNFQTHMFEFAVLGKSGLSVNDDLVTAETPPHRLSSGDCITMNGCSLHFLLPRDPALFADQNGSAPANAATAPAQLKPLDATQPAAISRDATPAAPLVSMHQQAAMHLAGQALPAAALPQHAAGHSGAGLGPESLQAMLQVCACSPSHSLTHWHLCWSEKQRHVCADLMLCNDV